ncbi:MAG: cation diffusion facilitator family transporter [Kiloniellales bacterium]
MAAQGSKKVVIAAFLGNGLIAVTKFVAAAMTGSAAMFSEAVHSLADTTNQALLLYGMTRAARPADARHPFGYGRELYFWAFVVAILIFAAGAGVSLYEGIAKLQHPEPVTDAYINYIVLGLAIVFEGGSFFVALKEFNKVKGGRGYLAAVRVSKDAALFTVLLEDSAALLGLLIALTGIALSEALDVPALDAVASILIGLMLAGVALLLAYETKGLLIGEAADPAVEAELRRILAAERGILRINELLTMHLGPRDVLLNLSLDFKGGLTSDEVERAISALERRIKAARPEITRVFIEAQDRRGHERGW